MMGARLARWGPLPDPRSVVSAGSIVMLEALLLVVLASLVPRMLGADAEAPSAWAIVLLVGGAALFSYRLGEAELSGGQRWLLGVAMSVVVLQVVARVDLSETARVWSLEWLREVTDPESGAWRGSERLDHLLSVGMLALAWFRGVALGGADLEERSLPSMLPVTVAVFAVGFVAGDGAGVIGTVRASALAFLAVALLAVAFRNAGRLTTAEGGFGSMGLTFASTLGVMTAVAIVFMLVVTLLVAAVGGTGVAAPVTQALGEVLRVVATALAWVVWILLWPIRELVSSGNPVEPLQICFVNEAGDLECAVEQQPEPVTATDDDGDSDVGLVAFRVFGGIGLVLGVTVLAALLFRRVWRRRKAADEERESLWGEADPLGDLWSGLRSLGNRLRRRGGAAEEPGIGGLYLAMLADAESRGTSRPLARTPLQFAPTLERLYRSALPGEISRFCEQRYGDRAPAAAEVSRLRAAWEGLMAEGSA